MSNLLEADVEEENKKKNTDDDEDVDEASYWTKIREAIYASDEATSITNEQLTSIFKHLIKRLLYFFFVHL